MPPLHTLILAGLTISPFVYSLILLLGDTQTPPYRRTVRALGSGFLIKGCIGGALATIGLVVEGQLLTSLPLLFVTLTCIAVFRIMQLEGV